MTIFAKIALIKLDFPTLGLTNQAKLNDHLDFSSSYSFGRFSTIASRTSPVPIPWTDG